MSDKSFVVSSFTANLAEKLEQQLGYTRQPCGCIDHRSPSPLEFPEDSYEDEPEDEDYDDGDLDDEDEDDEDLDDDDLEDDDFDDNDEDDEDNWEDQPDNTPVQNTPNGHVHHHHHHHHGKDTTVVSDSSNDKRQFAVMLKVRKALEEENRKTKLLLAQKEKLEKGEWIHISISIGIVHKLSFVTYSPKWRLFLIPSHRTYSIASETTSRGRSAPHKGTGGEAEEGKA